MLFGDTLIFIGKFPCPRSSPVDIAPRTYSLAEYTASGSVLPRQRALAMAEDNVHPVPCVFVQFMREAWNQ